MQLVFPSDQTNTNRLSVSNHTYSRFNCKRLATRSVCPPWKTSRVAGRRVMAISGSGRCKCGLEEVRSQGLIPYTWKRSVSCPQTNQSADYFLRCATATKVRLGLQRTLGAITRRCSARTRAVRPTYCATPPTIWDRLVSWTWQRWR